MDTEKYIEIIKNKHFHNYKKMNSIFRDDFKEFLKVYENFSYKEISILDFSGKNIVYTGNFPEIKDSSLKSLLKEQTTNYGLSSSEEEIISSFAIEGIALSRHSVRSILKGIAPKDNEEEKILGIKKGFDFISDFNNKITEENIFKLYNIAILPTLSDENKLLPNHFYRHDGVEVVSNIPEHSGLEHSKIPLYMKSFVKFINSDDDISALVKASIIHFYFAYIHPYFDGNGRMARLLHLWFLISKGYKSALFVPFSCQIEKTRKDYYNAFSLIESNKKISNVIDLTPFIAYFIENVYNQIGNSNLQEQTLNKFYDEKIKGNITEKECDLWNFVLSNYGKNEFSTKELEKDFGNAAYATIRNFVLKFEKMELLSVTKYKNRNKYKVI